MIMEKRCNWKVIYWILPLLNVIWCNLMNGVWGEVAFGLAGQDFDWAPVYVFPAFYNGFAFIFAFIGVFMEYLYLFILKRFGRFAGLLSFGLAVLIPLTDYIIVVYYGSEVAPKFGLLEFCEFIYRFVFFSPFFIFAWYVYRRMTGIRSDV